MGARIIGVLYIESDMPLQSFAVLVPFRTAFWVPLRPLINA